MPLAAVDVYDPFSSEDFLTLKSIDVLETPKLRAVFSDGVTRVIDFSEVIDRNHWFHALSAPTTFETVEVINDGRGLQWITGVDYCVDALRIMADKQLHGVS